MPEEATIVGTRSLCLKPEGPRNWLSKGRPPAPSSSPSQEVPELQVLLEVKVRVRVTPTMAIQEMSLVLQHRCLHLWQRDLVLNALEISVMLIYAASPWL